MSEVSMEDDCPEEVWDENADFILIVEGVLEDEEKKYRVCSEVLSQGSSYFKKLFNSFINRQDASQMDGLPVVTLVEDSWEAMHIVLSHLHFKISESPVWLKAQTVFFVHQYSEKYKCQAALRSWIDWQLCHTNTLNCERVEYGLLLETAFSLKSAKAIQLLCKEIIANVNGDFESQWTMHEDINNVPRAIVDKLKAQVAEHRNIITRRIADSARATHPKGKDRVTYWTSRWRGLAEYPDRKTRERARRADEKGFRVHLGEYFAFFLETGLWPNVDGSYSLDDIRGILEHAAIKPFDKCKAGANCPVRVQIKELEALVEKRLESIEGPTMGEIEQLLQTIAAKDDKDEDFYIRRRSS